MKSGSQGKVLWINNFGQVIPEDSTEEKTKIVLQGSYRKAMRNHQYWYEVKQPNIVKEILLEFQDEDREEWLKEKLNL